MKHLKYLNYLIRHKWFVFLAGIKFKAPLWRLIIHDWSKFLPSEWFPYAESFYGGYKERPQHVKDAFDSAWNHHQKRNKHHFQYWVLIEDSGAIKPLEIPEKYLREIASDWSGAGRAITGKWEVWSYYQKVKDKTLLHPKTRQLFEELLLNTKLD